jgi:probable F420-dependent oxidoreductase
MRDIKFGLFSISGDLAAVLRAAKAAEAQGFYSMNLNDHYFTPFGPPQTPQLECFTTLTAIAAATTKLRVGPCVAAVSFRPPPLLAKIAATLDIVSNGRLDLGLGAGWQPEEYHAHAIPYPSNAERIDQLGEAVKLIKAMWTEAEPIYKGRYFSIDKAYCNPRPTQKPHPPIMIGGSGTKVLKIAGTDADIINLIPPVLHGKDPYSADHAVLVKFDGPELKQRIQMLHRFAKEAGRDPNEIEIGGLVALTVAKSKSDAEAAVRATVSQMGFPNEEAVRRAPVMLIGTPDEVKRELRSRIEETGMTYFIVFPTSEETVELFANQVMPEFRR